MAALLRLKEGYFSYGDKEVLANVSLEVTRGEVLCILGANGCGKTTLLRCLNGALKLNKGNVYLGEQDIYKMSVVDVARHTGFVFQEHSAPFPFSVLEVVRMGRTPHLGFKNQTLVLRMICRLAESSMTVIMTSHLFNHALLYSSRVALMQKGSFIAMGDPGNIVTEANLKTVYGMDVKILEVPGENGGDSVRFCIPATSPMDVVASGLPGIVNEFNGKSDVNNGIAQVTIDDIRLSVITRISGPVKVRIPSEGIIVSRFPFSSNGRNIFKGKITSIKIENATILLEIDIGKTLTLSITQQSLKELGIITGNDVFVTFRVTAITLSPHS